MPRETGHMVSSNFVLVLLEARTVNGAWLRTGPHFVMLYRVQFFTCCNHNTLLDLSISGKSVA